MQIQLAALADREAGVVDLLGGDQAGDGGGYRGVRQDVA